MTNPQQARRLTAGAAGAPALVVLGAPRCGTTSLAKWLDAAGLGVGVKDSFYLMDDDAGLRGRTHITTHGVAGYLSLFPPSRSPTVECTAGYVYQRQALEFYRDWAAPPAFVLIARDPVERLRSVYRYFAGNLGTLPRSMSFPDYVDALFAGSVGLPDQSVSSALQQGCYATALRPWVLVFGHHQIHVVRFEDLEARPAEVVGNLVRLAGGTPSDLDGYSFRAHNQSYVPRSRLVSGVTARARGWVPAGRVRAWGGERVRRLQAGREHRPASESAPDGAGAAMERLSEFYAGPNRDLATQFHVSTAAWT